MSGGIIVLIVVVVLVVLALIYVASTFNKLTHLRNIVKDQWAQIDVHLKRRSDLIPNLVETVKVIEKGGFYDHYMESVFIPASVTYVGNGAFSWCHYGPEYLSVTFENKANLSYVGSHAFERYCLD